MWSTKFCTIWFFENFFRNWRQGNYTMDLYKGYFVTDLSGFIFDQPARWSIQALTDAEIYTIRKSEYDKIKIIIPRWPELERLFIVRCFTTLEDRIFCHLSMTAEERYHFSLRIIKNYLIRFPYNTLHLCLVWDPKHLAVSEKSNFPEFLIFIKPKLQYKPDLCDIQLNKLHNEASFFYY